MARLLLIDDDRDLLEVLGMALEDAGHAVERVPDGLVGWTRLRAEPWDLVISDVNMPGLDGFSLCRRLRAEGHGMPLILLTSRDHEVDEAMGLDLGADDYVTKPFRTRVLLARIAALLRREELRAGGVEDEVVEVGNLRLALERLEVRYAGVPVTLTVSEFRLIETLARRPGVIYSREQLLERVRGDDSVVVERIIDTWVRRIRRKIEAVAPGFDELETVVGAGYRWKDG